MALPPAEKLPLALRKNIRDNWESKKTAHEESLSKILGVAWTIDINPLAIFPYGKPNSYATENTGSMINEYVEDAIGNIKRYVEANGDFAKDEINSVASAHVLVMYFDEKKKFSYCGAEINADGQLAIIFTEGNLGSNIHTAFESKHLTQALNEAPTTPSGVSFLARMYIKQVYDVNIPEIQKGFNELLKEEIKLEPRFEENFAKLKAAKKVSYKEWEENVGSFTRFYFEALRSNLKRKQFGEDEMLQEGLLEAVDKKTVVFRVVDEIKVSYNECVIEDGILYIQTTPEYYGSNIDNAGDKVIDLL